MHGFITADECTLYIDTSALLYQRGLRQKTAPKCRSEQTSPPASSGLSGWQSGMPLLDPMCGSNTFPTEAA